MAVKTHTINSLLKRKKLSQSELARAVGCSPQFICQMLSGDRELSRFTAPKIAKATNTTLVFKDGAFMFAEGK